MNLYLDIETIPDQSQGALETYLEGIAPPGNYKKQESIDKWMAENAVNEAEKEWRKTSLNGTKGEIISIGLAIDNDEPIIISRTLNEGEDEMLKALMNFLEHTFMKKGAFRKPVWVGHYITGFDLRFIWQRCVVNNVRPVISIPFEAKPWGDEVYDTCLKWTGLKGNSSGSLDDMSKAFGLQGKDGMDGSKVWDAIKAGEYEKVFDYCKQDVELTRSIYKRMNFDEA